MDGIRVGIFFFGFVEKLLCRIFLIEKDSFDFWFLRFIEIVSLFFVL